MNLNDFSSEERAVLRPLLHKILALLDSQPRRSTSCSTCKYKVGISYCDFYQAAIPDDWFVTGCSEFVDEGDKSVDDDDIPF